MAVDMVAVLAFSSPKPTDCRITCTSNGIINVFLSIKPLHKPRSTGELSRTIHRKNMHKRLHDDFALSGTMPFDPLAEKYDVRASMADNVS